MEADDPVSHLRNNLNCSICLEVFTKPLSLPCGHSFCQECIHEHWDREVASSPMYTCPDCRLSFPQRPEPQRNVSLTKVVDDIRALERRSALLPPVQTASGARGAVPARCQRHLLDVTMYCSSDSRCICHKCMLTTCRHHEVQDLEERCQQEKAKLANDLPASERQQKHTEEELIKWKCKMENIEEFHEKTMSGIRNKFDQVRKTLDEIQVLVEESVICEKTAALAQAAEHVGHLERHLQDLEKHHKEAEVLLRNDRVAFLEGLPQLMPVGATPRSPNVQLSGNLQMEVVTRILPEVTKLLQMDLPQLLHPEKPVDKRRETSGSPSGIAVNDACCVEGTSPATPRREPARISALRAQLCKDYRNLQFDPETANKHLEISHGNCKATHRSRRNGVPDSPNRFQKWQVMCTEGFSEGSHYWEVIISTLFVDIGVALGSLKRTNEQESTIGKNSSSWSLQLRSMHHSAWHNSQETKLQPTNFTQIGIYLDVTGGTLAFYGVKDGSMRLLHSCSCHFSETVFPVFWIGEDAQVTICTIPNTAMEAETEDQNIGIS
ncbi:tripartite motif-containing protein 65-like [Bufo gargarizans]|uniref:tripartite motif-containing protein 65-like n=1 Tax=Bufo gargarizans TaxID=30331 RepID=UPI001CF15F80|nr:tripartite motif-containing protein 65-like [Bufo gargarizans]